MLNILYEICFGQIEAFYSFWPLLAGAGLGLVKGIDDSMKADKERERQAEIQRWSPWTGLQGRQVQDPSLFGNVAQGAFAGGMAGNMFGAGGSPTSLINQPGAGGFTQNVPGGNLIPLAHASQKMGPYQRMSNY